VPYLQESAELSQQIHARDELRASYALLAAVYETQGNAVEALRYYKLFSVVRDSIFNIQESDRLTEASVKVETLKKDTEIESLKDEARIAALELEREHWVTAALVAVLVSLATVVVILSRYSRKLRHGSELLESKNAELARLNVELSERLHEIRTLSGLLPICAWCKNIRDDKGYWQQLEGYIADRTAAQFSHGICPECASKLEPDSGGRAR